MNGSAGVCPEEPEYFARAGLRAGVPQGVAAEVWDALAGARQQHRCALAGRTTDGLSGSGSYHGGVAAVCESARRASDGRAAQPDQLRAVGDRLSAVPHHEFVAGAGCHRAGLDRDRAHSGALLRHSQRPHLLDRVSGVLLSGATDARDQQAALVPHRPARRRPQSQSDRLQEPLRRDPGRLALLPGCRFVRGDAVAHTGLRPYPAGVRDRDQQRHRGVAGYAQQSGARRQCVHRFEYRGLLLRFDATATCGSGRQRLRRIFWADSAPVAARRAGTERLAGSCGGAGLSGFVQDAAALLRLSETAGRADAGGAGGLGAAWRQPRLLRWFRRV